MCGFYRPGLQYREMSVGQGTGASVGSICDITYTVYRLSSGGYYKYSSGGTPVYMWSLGYGNEGRDDIGETYRFRFVQYPAIAFPLLHLALLHGPCSMRVNSFTDVNNVPDTVVFVTKEKLQR
jgi:hypothetical protein